MKDKQQKFMEKFICGIQEKNFKKLKSSILDIIHMCIK
jgi:hypothetical protein